MRGSDALSREAIQHLRGTALRSAGLEGRSYKVDEFLNHKGVRSVLTEATARKLLNDADANSAANAEEPGDTNKPPPAPLTLGSSTIALKANLEEAQTKEATEALTGLANAFANNQLGETELQNLLKQLKNLAAHAQNPQQLADAVNQMASQLDEVTRDADGTTQKDRYVEALLGAEDLGNVEFDRRKNKIKSRQQH